MFGAARRENQTQNSTDRNPKHPPPAAFAESAITGGEPLLFPPIYLFPAGTGTPGIFTLTMPRWLRLVK